jgi:hypothetical protein
MTAAFTAQRVRADSYDRKVDEHHMDFNSTLGFATCLVMVFKLCKNGLCWLAPQCSTWIWFAQGHCRRAAANNYAGNASRLDVQAGNVTNARVSTIVRLCQWRGVQLIIEQPARTVFYQTPAMRMVTEEFALKQLHIWLGAHGHSMPKPTLLLMCPRAMSWMKKTVVKWKRTARTEPDMQAKDHGWVKQGRWVTATANLKPSEHYPAQWCATVAAAYMQWVNEHGISIPMWPERMVVIMVPDEQEAGWLT